MEEYPETCEFLSAHRPVLLRSVSLLCLTLCLPLTSATGLASSTRPLSKKGKVSSKQDYARTTRRQISTVSYRNGAPAPQERKGKKGFVTRWVSAEDFPPSRVATRKRVSREAPVAVARARPHKSLPQAERVRYENPAPRLPAEVGSTAVAVSDRIEVIENASSGGTDLSRSLPSARRSSGGSRVNVSTRRIEVEIEPARVIQIQEALLKRGFFSGETTGVYDDATVDAMRQFQINQKIDATGYPTAQSLKLLGL